MSYLVLARKWRPQRFEDVVGQQHVLQALTHSLENERLHHAYLFAGTRGVGKTTLARILAKALNCERGISATPCGECSACHEIDEGRFVDLIEVDAASRTKVDDTREMLDNVQYSPTRGRYKVYLIDEVHMLSTHSFNALLKTLEEPPPHVKFLLATTDPQKLPVTVLSRCLQFNLKRLTPQLIAERLGEIATAESVKAEAGALALIARAAEGSLRDALSLMDQAIAFGNGAMPEAAVAEMLGALDRSQVVALLERLAENDAQGLLKIIADADEMFPDYRRLLDELASLLTRIAVYQATNSSDLEEDEQVDLIRLAGVISPADAQLFYQIAVIGKRDLALAPDPRAGVEMTLLRMLAFKPGAAPPPERLPADAVARSAAGKPARQPAKRSAAPKSAAKNAAKSSVKGAAVDHAPVAKKSSDPSTDVEPTELADWHRLIGQLTLGGVARLLAANCAFVARDGALVQLSLDRRSESLMTDVRVKEIAAALSNYLGDEVTVRVDIDGVVAKETPVQRAARREHEKKADAEASLASDAGVQEMQKLFDAELQSESVQLIDGDTDGSPAQAKS